MNDTRVTVRLPDTDHAVLKRLAEADRRTLSFLAREAIHAYVDGHDTDQENPHA